MSNINFRNENFHSGNKLLRTLKTYLINYIVDCYVTLFTMLSIYVDHKISISNSLIST